MALVTTGRTWAFVLVVTGVVFLGAAGIATPPPVRIGDFSGASLSDVVPPGWEQIRFGENESSTRYRLVRTDTTIVVRARSSNGASGLITRDRVRLTDDPILEWRWKVDGVVENGDVTPQETDDAPARVYVTFDYSGLGFIDRLKLMLLRRVGYADAPSRVLNYVWASQRTQETTRSAYTDQIVMIPVQTGPDRVGEWVREQVNVRADYRDVFGEDPPPVNGVPIMTDRDNTGETAQAWYGDIVFRASPAP